MINKDAYQLPPQDGFVLTHFSHGLQIDKANILTLALRPW